MHQEHYEHATEEESRDAGERLAALAHQVMCGGVAAAGDDQDDDTSPLTLVVAKSWRDGDQPRVWLKTADGERDELVSFPGPRVTLPDVQAAAQERFGCAVQIDADSWESAGPNEYPLVCGQDTEVSR